MSVYFNENTGDLVDAAGAEVGVYTDSDGHIVEVRPGDVHITQIGEKKWTFTTGPREATELYGQAPAIHDGAYFANGKFRFVEHGAENPEVVEDLACDEGKVVWGKNYVRTKDGREGPTVDSLRSQRRLKDYMRLTGHRAHDHGERAPNKLEELRSRVEARKLRRETIKRERGTGS